MGIKIYIDGVTLFNSELNNNFNKISQYNAVNKINNAKITIDSNQVETTNDSQTLLFGTTSDLESGTYNLSTSHSNDNYAWYDSTHDIIYAGVIYDNYSDGSVDATKWTGSGTETEVANTYIQSVGVAATTTLDSTGSSGIDLKPSGTNSEVFIRVYAIVNDASTSSTTKRGRLILRDSSGNEVILNTFLNVTNSSVQASATATLRIVLDISNAVVYTDRDTSSTIDITSLVGTTWFLRVETYSNAAGPTTTARMYPIVYVNNDTIPASTIESVRTSVTPTVATGFVLADDLGDGIGTSTIGISADNGSGYSTITHKTWGTISSTGTTVSVKYTLQGTSREKLVKIDSQCLLYSD